MKNFYLLPLRVSLLLCVLFSSPLLLGQTRTEAAQLNKVSNRIDIRRLSNRTLQTLKSKDLNKVLVTSDSLPLDVMKSKREVLSRRNATSKTFVNEDDSFTSLIAAGPIHYRNNGKWEDIVTSIKKEKAGIYGYSNKANIMESYYGENSRTGIKSVIKEGELTEFLNTSMYWEKNGVAINKIANSGAPATLKADELYYKNIYGTISAEFKSLTGKRKLTYVIPDILALGKIPAEAEYLVFSEDIHLPQGWKYKLNGNVLLLEDTQDEPVFLYHAPVVFEEYLSSEKFQLTKDKPVHIEVKVKGNIITYLLKIKQSWLNDDSRIFPLAIDPSISAYPKNEVYSSGLCDSSGVGFDDIIQIGYWYNDEIDGYVRFDLSAIPAGSTITSTTSRLWRYNGQGVMSGSRNYIPGSSNLDPRHWLAYQNSGVFGYYYEDMFYSYTGNLSTANSTNFNTNNQFKDNIFSAAGRTNVQNGLADGYVNILFYPTGNAWTPINGAGNYGVFYGYSAATNRKPYLNITYTSACSTITSASSDRYINDVKFLGTLNPDTDQTSDYTSPGYKDYRAASAKAKQIPGGGINVFINTTGSASVRPSYIKAWVDWNKDGIYDPVTEKVFDSGSVLTVSTTFGYVVPLGTLAGNYNIRLRNYYYDYQYDNDGYYFGPCGPRANGETEDYSFDVIPDCAAKITGVTNGQRCGSGTVTLSATKSATATGFEWYSSEFGGSVLGTGNTYTTVALSEGTYTYYVSATNGTCISGKRTPVKAVVSPTPNITFSTSNPDICGNVASIIVTSSGDKQEVELFTETFESGLGKFTSNSLIDNGTTVNAATVWQNKSSTFIPTGAVWYPAINSGSNKFAFATSDVLPVSQPDYSINTALTYSSVVINTTGYLNLKLSFDGYYSYFGTSGEGLFVEVSTNGTTWFTARNFNSNIGIGTRFETKEVDLSAYINQPNLRLRFRYMAGWADGVAIDNIRLYGDKPLATNFTWSGDTGTIYNAADCVSAVPSGGAASVCVKPNSADLEVKENWNVNATANLSNGCSATATIIIPNNSKIWNTTATDWLTNNWKPNSSVPIADKCVIIKSPVNILSSTNAVAKNLRIESTGKLNIAANGSLTVTDGIINQATDADLVIASDGNLKQVTDVPASPNTGSATATRNIKFRNNARAEYNYLISPVVGQRLKTIYPGISYVLYHNEVNNMFGNSSGAYIPGRGLAVKEATMAGVSANNVDATFKGALANGIINFPMAYTDAAHGYNLVGNPYPSNINLQTFYTLNSGKISSTIYFWDNAANNVYQQQGSGYNGRAYAVLNASNGMGNAAGYLLSPQETLNTKVPNAIAKVGQGFMVRALGAGTNLVFNNSIRTTDSTGASFFSKPADSATNRYWLRLITPTGLVNTIGVVYYEGGSASFGMDDSEMNVDASDMLYSLADDRRLQIEGRPVFEDTEKINLGSHHFAAGNYTLSPGDKEGIFAGSQNIYLKDKQTGTITNLSEGDYTFAANAGESTGRFEIIYQPETVLTTDAVSKEKLVVYRNAGDFVVEAKNTKITEIEVYDTSGRLVYAAQPHSVQARIDAGAFSNGIYILRVNQNGEITARKIIK
ncbi:GEVED domain-containing protein [Kaistella sp. 97-N-M2]|uniref:Ig-like domain-containing protein n=1 Tax=Kaistella sp. 97-N-M2 TaxID=2908645 RepID=UPI001F44BB5D|nr:GEVED domain-containing protein [Kaistella sp. 97-N-M2]UJF28801.1 GEVED domain-containing protein [Kaistella sp. 97-N-M2]